MSIFNSLGSNYDLKFVLKSLFASDNSSNLIKLLEEKYKGRAILLYKGREAIELALKLANLPKDSAIAVNGFTCFAVYKAVKDSGYSCELLDIEASNLNFSPETFLSRIKQNPKIGAVIIQNTLGYPCNIEEIAKICKENDIVLVEDLAHSVGTIYKNGKEAGSIGDFVCLSFSQDKMIDAVSGGALIVRNKKYNLEKINLESVGIKYRITDKFYPLLTYAIRRSYSVGVGKIIHFVLKNLHLLSTPMSDLKGIHSLPNTSCYLTQIELDRIGDNLKHRRKIAKIYADNINPIILFDKHVEQIRLSTNLRFPLKVKNRENLIKLLKRGSIYISDIWYDAPIAPKKYMTMTDYKNNCPNSEKISSEILNLPTHRDVSEEDALRISEKVNLWIKLQQRR